QLCIQESTNSERVSNPASYLRSKGYALQTKPGKKRKGGKSRAIGISGLGRFFLFFPDFYFLKRFLLQPEHEIARNLLDCVWNSPSVRRRGIDLHRADSDGDVWRAAGKSAGSVLADGAIPCAVRSGDCDIADLRSAGNYRRVGDSWKCA